MEILSSLPSRQKRDEAHAILDKILNSGVQQAIDASVATLKAWVRASTALKAESTMPPDQSNVYRA
jgi:hypothetical protein